MGWNRRGEVARSVRWLGAPPTLVALVLLVLNDRVWKEQWPGLLTGKLSDVAGLVVAPPLLALALSVCRVRRSAAWALGASGVGFALVKSTSVGAEFASAAWSLVMPSLVLRDPSDLVALPALVVAAACARWAGSPGTPGKRRTYLAIGSLALPVAVLATAATSCGEPYGVGAVTTYEGRFTDGSRVETRMVASVDPYKHAVVDASGELRPLLGSDDDRLGERTSYRNSSACWERDGQRCWRGKRGDGVVEASDDAGRTWQTDFAMSKDEVDSVLEEEGEEHCGERTKMYAQDVAVLDTPAGPLVAVAAANAGLLVRTPDGRWTRHSLKHLRSLVKQWTSTTPPGVPGTATGDPGGATSGTSPTKSTTTDPTPTLTPVEPVAPAFPAPRSPSPSPSNTRTSLPCASPTTTVVTPDPRNGPPVTVTRCPSPTTREVYSARAAARSLSLR